MSFRSSLLDRPLLLGILISLFWHLFWFFSVTITVGPSARLAHRAKTRSVSLGAVLDDTIFKTLVENRPQVSMAFYRHMSDFTPAPAEPEAHTIQRHSPGDVVSIPLGKKFTNVLKEIISGDKPSPDFDLGAGVGDAFAGLAALEGEVRYRRILTRPREPHFSAETEAAMGETESVIEFTVDALGAVSDAQTIISSKDPEVDRVWLEYIERWRFASADSRQPHAMQRGKVRFRIGR